MQQMSPADRDKAEMNAKFWLAAAGKQQQRP